MKHDTEYICVCETWDELVLYPIAELIRCKDCKWWNQEKQSCIEWYDSPYAPVDGFCFRAERKEE